MKQIRQRIKSKTRSIFPFKQSLKEGKLQLTNRSFIPFRGTFMPNLNYSARHWDKTPLSLPWKSSTLISSSEGHGNSCSGFCGSSGGHGFHGGGHTGDHGDKCKHCGGLIILNPTVGWNMGSHIMWIRSLMVVHSHNQLLLHLGTLLVLVLMMHSLLSLPSLFSNCALHFLFYCYIRWFK